MDACYIVRRNAISASALERFRVRLAQFHELRKVFITSGIRKSISLPHQHALSHYFHSIQLFGSPNGLCSSITESKHIKAVKEPWRRSSRCNALTQILQTLLRLEKMEALHRQFSWRKMLKGTTATYMAGVVDGEDPQEDLCSDASNPSGVTSPGAYEDGTPIDGICDKETLSIVELSAKPGAYIA